LHDQLLTGISKRADLQFRIAERHNEWHGDDCQTQQHQSAQ
jgi:hypothetical protein